MRRLFAAISMLVVPTMALAIVDVHEEYYSNLGEPAFSTFSFSVEGARGTKTQNEFEVENHSLLRTGKSTWMFVGSLNYAETNDEKSDDNQFAHIRYVRGLGGRHGFDVLAQYQQDEFALIDSRTLFGGGYRYEWAQSGARRGLLGIGAIREKERYTTGARSDLWRANLYVTFGQPVEVIPDSWLTFSAYAQPALRDTGDVRAIAVLGLTTQLTRNLGIEFSADYSYDSEPEAGVDSADLEYSIGVEWTLR